MSSAPSVVVTIVTYNSQRYIGRCLESLLEQSYPNKQIAVVDNASTDETRTILKRFESVCSIVYNDVNTGFAAAQNQAMALFDTDWVLALNPDVLLAPGFIATLVGAGEMEDSIGTVCGKLRSMTPAFELPNPPTLDSTGIFLTPALRHLDRGSGSVDDGRYDRPEFVFGATGAAALYRRRMINDIAIEGEFFDSDFFAYREDADVAWRAQLLGWKCLYVPFALGHHVRSVLPENRRSVPAILNMHSVKNRWLLRINNITPGIYRRHWLSISIRDLMVIGGCLIVEWSSLPAFPFILRNWRRLQSKRQSIMHRRRADDRYMAAWLADRAVGIPVEARLAARLQAFSAQTVIPTLSDAHPG